jgi:hypothetical protein
MCWCRPRRSTHRRPVIGRVDEPGLEAGSIYHSVCREKYPLPCRGRHSYRHASHGGRQMRSYAGGRRNTRRRCLPRERPSPSERDELLHPFLTSTPPTFGRRHWALYDILAVSCRRKRCNNSIPPRRSLPARLWPERTAGAVILPIVRATQPCRRDHLLYACRSRPVNDGESGQHRQGKTNEHLTHVKPVRQGGPHPRHRQRRDISPERTEDPGKVLSGESCCIVLAPPHRPTS